MGRGGERERERAKNIELICFPSKKNTIKGISD
jgi:hypothetical protein